MSRGGTAGAATAVTGGVLLLDQATKALVRSEIELGERIQLLGPLDLVHVRNTGIAFGAFAGGGVLLVVGAAAALLALVAFFLGHARRPLIWLPTGLLIGGACGNLVDRARAGSVTDFFKVPHWPAFNIADIAITCGVVALVVVIERGGRSG